MAGLLADTHVLLWSMREVHRLSPEAREWLNAPAPPMFSVVSIWEIAIKANLGRADFPIKAEKARNVLLESGWLELEFTGAHAISAGGLPRHHNDPFDRALIGQAVSEQLKLVTADAALLAYGKAVQLM